MVTRKDLNVIAATFNSRLVLMQECMDSTKDWSGEYQRDAHLIWELANRMYSALSSLNPNMCYTKWNAAVTKNCRFEFLQ